MKLVGELAEVNLQTDGVSETITGVARLLDANALETKSPT
jgi:hypothetical protein